MVYYIADAAAYARTPIVHMVGIPGLGLVSNMVGIPGLGLVANMVGIPELGLVSNMVGIPNRRIPPTMVGIHIYTRRTAGRRGANGRA